MAGAAGVIQLHRAVAFTPGAIQSIPLTLGSDVDLSSPSGQTGGISARAILNAGAAGNFEYYDLNNAGPYTIAMAANQELPLGFCYVVNSGTTITPVAQL